MLQSTTTYNPQSIFKNKHFNTIYRTFFHQFSVSYSRERLETNDGDFLDLDFSNVGSHKIVVIIHGLEGSSNSKYVQSLSHVLNNSKFDTVAINLRGCSGEPNRLLSSYHSGKTDDLDAVLTYLENHFAYQEYYIVGYSLGGNMTLKYAGEKGSSISKKIQKVVGVSVPCDLKGSSESLSTFWNKIYMERFLITLKQKALEKLKLFPNSFLNQEKIKNATNFFDFDNLYTAPAHGFIDANDYWSKCSSKQFIPEIKIPSLLVTAQDDPFLSPTCFPVKEAQENVFFTLEMTKYGGHVGFNDKFPTSQGLWLEDRIVNFFQNEN
jgi:hypothetical protein